MWDVVVAGAGPGGATAALVLARHGARVLLLERERLPRVKACAGALSPRCLDLLGCLGLDPSPLIKQDLERVTFTLRGRDRVVPGPLGGTVDRAEADAWLVERAERAGATLGVPQSVDAIRPAGDGWSVDTSQGTLRARAVVGADGWPSRVAGSLGMRRLGAPGWAVEAVLPVETQGARIFLDVVRHGYGWIIPRGPQTSVGTCSFARRPRGLAEALAGLLSRAFPGIAPIRRRGHALPAVPVGRPGRGSALLVGDAAGLVDPLTGEGIYGAVKSGMMAARAIAACLDDGCPAAAAVRYASLMKQLRVDLLWARRLARLFYRLPGGFHRYLGPDSRLTECLRRLLAGRMRYRHVPAYLLGRGGHV